MHSRPRRTDICISRLASSSSTDFTIEGDISPSLADPALLSVVGVVDGQFTGFITKEGRNYIYRVHRSRLLCFKSISRPASQLKRTRPLTSYPVSQSRVLSTKSQSWSRGAPTRSRSLSRDSPNKKIGSALFALTSTVTSVF